MRVSLFCYMVVSSEDGGVPSNCSLEDSISNFVNDATEDSAWLLSRIHQHRAKDVNNTLITCIERWVSAQNTFHIKSPTALVEKWVNIQCEKVKGKDPETCELAPTILSMVSSLENLEQPSCIILEEELHSYIKMRDQYPDFCKRMQKHISATISRMESRRHVFERCEGLIKCGMKLGSSRFEGHLIDCRAYMFEALRMLIKFNKKYKKLFDRVKYLNLVSDTCFSYALIRRLSSPTEKEDYIDAIEIGLKNFSEQNTKLTDRECTLFFYVLDLLSLEGNMELKSRVYRILTKRFGRKSEDLFNIAWQSGNLNHGLCSSPLDDYFIKIVQDQSFVSTDVPFWRTCMESKLLETSLSVFTTLSSIKSDDDTYATKAKEITDEVLISASVAENPFLAARLYFNLAEKMIAKGLIFEALTYAEKGYRLRDNLLSECFIITFEEKQYVCEGETKKAKTYACKSFDMRDPSRVSSLRSYYDGTNVYVPTPWNLLKCYLESALQIGTLKYMIGSADEALHILRRGCRISGFQDLPAFYIRFTIALGKCFKLQGDIKEERRIIMSSMNVVVARSTFHEQDLSTLYVDSLLRKNVIADAFGVQNASILYNICCFSLEHKDTSETAILSTESIMIGLQMALILSREVPKLYEKVSRRLAVLCASSSKDEKNSTLKRVSLSQQAAYFHQLSVGSYFNSCFLSQDQTQKGGSHVLRPVLAPHSLQELEESVLNFFKSLPSVTIVCISMLSDKLEDLLPKSPTSVWLMISRFSVKNGPIVVILPVCNTLTDFSYKKGISSEGDWKCPWADSVFDQVAPALRLILEENYKTSNLKLNSKDAMQKKKTLNNTLKGFLRKFQITWLGSWKQLLLGEWDDIDGNFEEIENTLESGCYIGTSGGGNGIYEPDLAKIFKSAEETHKKVNEKKCRNPVILVPHINIQMIPWESLPILEKQEIYRMPSVGGVLRSISKCDDPSKDKTVTDPLDCFYFIIPIPNDDLKDMVYSFEKWSNKYGFQGKAGCSVTVNVDELREALESRDLFVYAGHGSGKNYIPGSEIRKVTNCCAAILMGLSSGYIDSSYHALDSAPLDYLMAGSPAIVANLWPVCSKTMIPFTGALYEEWTKATSSEMVQCTKKGKKRKLIDNTLCKHEMNLGSSMSLARDACLRRYIYGAIPVIYGVPTRIRTSRQK